jgi:hypothetical protein
MENRDRPVSSVAVSKPCPCPTQKQACERLRTAQWTLNCNSLCVPVLLTSLGLVAFRENYVSCQEHNMLPFPCVITISQTLPDGMDLRKTLEVFHTRKKGSKPLHPTGIIRKQVKCYRVKRVPYVYGLTTFYTSPDQKFAKKPGRTIAVLSWRASFRVQRLII